MVDKAILPEFLGGKVDDSFLIDGEANHLKHDNSVENKELKHESTKK